MYIYIHMYISNPKCPRWKPCVFFWYRVFGIALSTHSISHPSARMAWESPDLMNALGQIRSPRKRISPWISHCSHERPYSGTQLRRNSKISPRLLTWAWTWTSSHLDLAVSHCARAFWRSIASSKNNRKTVMSCSMSSCLAFRLWAQSPQIRSFEDDSPQSSHHSSEVAVRSL